MQLYFKSNLSLNKVSAQILEVALPSFEQQLREGLNVGGGEYYKFTKDAYEIILVCNDLEHPEVFVESRKNFPYYCYVRKGSDGLLEEMLSALSGHGFICELGDEV